MKHFVWAWMSVMVLGGAGCRTVAPAQVAVPMDESRTFAAGVTSSASASLFAPVAVNTNDVISSPIVGIVGPYVTVRALPPGEPLAAEVTATAGVGVENLGAFGPGGSVGVRFWSGAREPGVRLGLEGKAGVAVDLGHIAQTRDFIWFQPELRGLISYRFTDSFAIGARPGVQVQRLITSSPRDVTFLVFDLPVGALWAFDNVNFGLEAAISVAGFTPSARFGAQLETAW